MAEKRLFGVIALFDSPDKLLSASKAVTNAGYVNFDAYAPYPVHGLDNAMKLKPSRIGILTLIAGLTGVVSLVLFTWWANSIDYPLWIGGKPYFSWPSYVPLMFEVGVLLGSVVTVVSLLAIWLGLPRNSHPLHDTEFMKRVSSDRFGICIEASDKKFAEQQVIEFLLSCGAEKVDVVYDTTQRISLKEAILEPKFIVAIVVVAALSSGAVYWGLNRMLLLRPWSSLNNQEKVLPETLSVFYADGFSMREPVNGTVARNQMPNEFVSSLSTAGKYLENPLLPSKHVMEVGQRDFNIYCSPCHGYFADGDSRLQGQFPNPPSLHIDSLRLSPDGFYYSVITNGFQNIMPSYSRLIPRDERWAIIWYIRALQKSQHVEVSSTK
jgi:membrane-bound inhibitor of C-type lysozyme